MATNGFADSFDVERSERDVGAGIEDRAVGMLGASIDLDDRFNGRKGRLPWIAARGHDPVDDLRGGVGAGLDPAMALLDGGRTDQLGGRDGAKIADDIGFEGGWLPLRASR